MSLRKAARRRNPADPAPESTADPAETSTILNAAAAPPAADTTAGQPARPEADADRPTLAAVRTPAFAAAGPAAMLALLRGLGTRRQVGLAASVVAMLVAGGLVGRAFAPARAGGDPAVAALSASVADLRADLAAVRGRVEGTAVATDVQALERRIVSMRESLERARTELAALVSQPAGALEQVRQQQAASSVQVATQLGRFEDALRDLGQKLEAADRRAAAPLVTGSLASTRPTEAVATPSSVDTGTTVQAKTQDARSTESRTASQQSDRTPDRPVVTGWVVHEVRRGVALVEGPSGLFEVGRGQTLPGVGKIETIERRGRGWALLTSRGTVEPAPW